MEKGSRSFEAWEKIFLDHQLSPALIECVSYGLVYLIILCNNLWVWEFILVLKEQFVGVNQMLGCLWNGLVLQIENYTLFEFAINNLLLLLMMKFSFRLNFWIISIQTCLF